MQIHRSVFIDLLTKSTIKICFKSKIRAKKIDTHAKPKKSGPKKWMNPESVHYMIQLY